MGISRVRVVDGRAIYRMGQKIITRQPEGIDLPGARNWIYLGKHEALLYHSDEISVGEKFAESGDEHLSTKAVELFGGIANDGRQFRRTQRVDESILDLLLNPPGNKYPALRPSKKRQRYEVMLGPSGMMITRPKFVGPNTRNFEDTLTGAGVDLDGSLSSDTQFNWNIDSGAITRTATGALFSVESNATADVDADTDDMYVEVELVQDEAGNSFLWFSAGRNTFYYPSTSSEGIEVNVGSPDTQVADIYDIDGSAFTLLASAGYTRGDGVFRMELDGSSIVVEYAAATINSTTYSRSFTGSGYRKADFGGFVGGGDTIVRNFRYGDIHAAVATPFTPPIAQRNRRHRRGRGAE